MSDKTVYFLRPIGQAGPIKIGCSKEPIKRLRHVEIWSPVELELVASAAGGFGEESVLHQMFGDSRRHGEWFDITPQLQSLLDYVARAGKLPPLDYSLRHYDAKKKDPTCRSKMTRRACPKQRREKWAVTHAVLKAERRVYTYSGHEFMRPTEIDDIIRGYQGFGAPMPSAGQMRLVDRYIAMLGELPSADRSFDRWVDWHRAIPMPAKAA